jgi:hypothetical protein
MIFSMTGVDPKDAPAARQVGLAPGVPPGAALKPRMSGLSEAFSDRREDFHNACFHVSRTRDTVRL